MCRAGGRRCPSHSNPEQIANRNARRRAAYALKKANSTPEGLMPVQAPTQALTEAQVAYFKDSKARTETGELVKVYHGASVEFDSFDPTRLGQGNDSWGNGFYFTDNQQTAQGYAADSKSTTANVKEFYMNLNNPLIVDGKENMSLNHIEFTKQQAFNMLKNHPTTYNQPDDEEETSWLGDYSSEYWDKEHLTEQEIDTLLKKVTEEYFDNVSWPELEGVFGRDNGALFLQELHKETGYDGVIVEFEDSKHYVAWFPEQMKLTSNQTPTSTHEF